jgi:predicted lipoprotein with Yx(FWY)xxD motif
MTRLTLLALTAATLIAAGCGDGNDNASNTDSSAMKTNTAMASDDKMQADAAMKDDTTKADDAMATNVAMKTKGTVVKIVSSDYGPVIADRKGEAFYLFDKENGKKSACYGDCATAWPPLLTKAAPRAGKGAKQKLLGTTKRRNGRLQVTYAGHPLYYYKDDTPGNILSQNVNEFGGLWLVVKPNGHPVT